MLNILLAYFIISCSNKYEKHIGEWTSTDKGVKGSLILNESHYAILVVGNIVIGGEEFEINGIKGECRYEIDYTKNPIWLDLIILEKEKGKVKSRFKGIVRFLTDDKIEYRLNFDSSAERFTKFDPTNTKNTIILDRVKK